MFNHAIRHPVKKAHTDIRNNEGLTPLTLAAKLGRKELFIQCLELSHVVKYKNMPCFFYLSLSIKFFFEEMKRFTSSV